MKIRTLRYNTFHEIVLGLWYASFLWLIVEYNNIIVGTYQYNIIQTAVRAPVQITHTLPHQIGTLNYTFIFLLYAGSILFIFHPTGSFLSGFLQERYGRKRCMILANVPSIFGWILLYYTHSTVSLYSSTVLMGLGIGFSEDPILSFIGDITEPRLRGSMASLACTSSMLGGLLTYFLGYLFECWTVALLSTLCPITCICLVILVPTYMFVIYKLIVMVHMRLYCL